MRYRLEAGTAQKRRLFGQATWWFGGFYTGWLNEYIATLSIKPSPLFIVELNSTRNEGREPAEAGTTNSGPRVRTGIPAPGARDRQ